MPPSSLRVFVSASTHDLVRHRRVVEQTLLDGGLHPITQEHFHADNRTLTEFLRDEIARCDAVVCLVGAVFGAAPADRPDRSYTQLEYDFAQEFARPVFVFLADDGLEPKAAPSDTAEQSAAQQAHRRALMQSHTCSSFREPETLQLLVRDVLPKLRAVSGQAPILYLYPPNEPICFAGRSAELRQFREALRRHSPAVIAVIGMGGQGKSTLVHRGLQDSARELFANGFWWNADREGFSFDLFLDQALGYFLPQRFDKRNFPEKRHRVALLVQALQERPLVLIVDGLERWLRGRGVAAPDAAHADRSAEEPDLDRLLEAISGLHNGSHLIITTRALPKVLDRVAVSLVPVYEAEKQFALEGLDDDASVNLLRACGVTGDDDALLSAAQQVGNHPLTLSVLGCHLRKRFGGHIGSLPASIQRGDIIRNFDAVLEDTLGSLPKPGPAEALLTIAAHCLDHAPLKAVAFVYRQRRPTWLDLLAFRVEPAPGKSVEAAEADIAEVRELAISLADWHLLDWDARAQKLSLHPLIRGRFTREPVRRIHTLLSAWYAARPIVPNAITLDDVWPRRLALEHALRAGDVDRSRELLFGPFKDDHSFCDWLAAQGHLSYGVDVLGRAILATPDGDGAEFLLSRSALLYQLGRCTEARDEASRAIERLSSKGKATSGRNVNLARALVNRANAQRMIGRSADAVPDLDRALEYFERDPVGRRDDIAQVLSNRANALTDLGHWTRAEADYDRAVALCGANDDSPRIMRRRAATLANRAILRAQREEFVAAVTDFQAAMETYLRLEVDDRSESYAPRAGVLTAYGSTLREMGRTDDAAATLTQGIQIYDDLIAAGRRDVEAGLALAWKNMTSVYLARKAGQTAREASEKSTLIYQRLLADGREELCGTYAHVVVLRAHAELLCGNVAGASADYEDGFRLFREVIQRWPDEADIVVLYLQQATEAVRGLWLTNPPAARAILQPLVEKIEEIFASNDVAEAVQHTVHSRLDDLLSVLPGDDTTAVRLCRIRSSISES